MVIVYAVLDDGERVIAVTIQDGRTASGPTSGR
jgi:hypothetical protein